VSDGVDGCTGDQCWRPSEWQLLRLVYECCVLLFIDRCDLSEEMIFMLYAVSIKHETATIDMS